MAFCPVALILAIILHCMVYKQNKQEQKSNNTTTIETNNNPRR